MTGEKREGGWHVFVLLADGTEAERFLKLLHARAWLAGLGWFLVGDAGQLLERTIVDTAVWKPERLVFEADPILDPGFSQGPRPARVHEGGLLACPSDLDANDEAQFEKLLAMARTAAEPEAVAKRKVWEEARIGEIVAAGGDRHNARRTVEQWSSGVLLPDATIEFEDPEIGCVTVAQILENPERFDGETCFDPIEGSSLWPVQREILCRRSACPFLCAWRRHLPPALRCREPRSRPSWLDWRGKPSRSFAGSSSMPILTRRAKVGAEIGRETHRRR